METGEFTFDEMFSVWMAGREAARAEQMEQDCALSCPECKSGRYPAEYLSWEHGDDGHSIFAPATDDRGGGGEWVHRKEGKTWFFCGAAKYREAFRLRKSEEVEA